MNRNWHPAIQGVRVLGSMEKLEDVVTREGVQEVVVAGPAREHQGLADRCRRLGVSMWDAGSFIQDQLMLSPLRGRKTMKVLGHRWRWGLSGSHLVEALLARGDTVTVIDDCSTGSLRTRVSSWSTRDIDSFTALFWIARYSKTRRPEQSTFTISPPPWVFGG